MLAMDRKEEILNYIRKQNNDNLIAESLVDEMVYIENRLTELKKLPFIQVHPKDSAKQRATPAAKQYKELLQQYTNIIKVLTPKNTENDEGESPLRKWVKAHADNS